MFVPTGSVVVVRTAEPPLNDTVPRLVLPLLNVTEPAATPPYCPDTVAVRLTDCPKLDGFIDEVNVVVELALVTVWLTAVDVLPAKFESPVYTAVIEFVPTGSVVVAKTAEPPLSDTVPRLVLPLLNITVPVATPPNCPDTAAVRLTDCPKLEGFSDDFKVVEVLA